MKAIIVAGLAALAASSIAPAFGQEAGVTVRSIRVLAADPEKAAVFYEKAFGMSETRRPVNTDTFKEIVINSGSTAEKAKAAKSTPIVIATRRNKDEKPLSMPALILEVPDMDKAVAAVVAAGGKGGKPAKSGEGLTYCMVADNEGNPIELLLKQ
ncbi:MAG TPA: VOC family protein [Hyphomonadaceae bacterium]|nr:VOC family protein [Hyphomonadaceae bacterium]